MTDVPDQNRRRIAAQQIDHIGVPLWRASSAFTRRMIETVQAAGFPDITVSDSELLPYLDLEGVSLTDIAMCKGVSRQAVHQGIHSLQKRGYVELVPHPDDRRARVARHSRKGLRLVRELQTVKAQIQADALALMGERKLRDLTRDLDRLNALFEGSGDPPE